MGWETFENTAPIPIRRSRRSCAHAPLSLSVSHLQQLRRLVREFGGVGGSNCVACWVGIDKPRARVLRTDRGHRPNRRAHEAHLQLVAPPLTEGRKPAHLAAGPRHEARLVHRRVPPSCAHELPSTTCDRAGVPGEPLGKASLEWIEVLREAVMEQVPDWDQVAVGRGVDEQIEVRQIE